MKASLAHQDLLEKELRSLKRDYAELAKSVRQKSSEKTPENRRPSRRTGTGADRTGGKKKEPPAFPAEPPLESRYLVLQSLHGKLLQEHAAEMASLRKRNDELRRILVRRAPDEVGDE